LKLAVK